MTDATATTSGKAPAGGSAMKILGRIVLYGGLGILLVLAFMDYRTKAAAQGTADEWRRVLSEREGGETGEQAELYYKELEQFIQGEPEIASAAPIGTLRGLAREAESYTWKGVFRDYVVHVGIGLGQGQPIVGIEGPGSVEEPTAPPVATAGGAEAGSGMAESASPGLESGAPEQTGESAPAEEAPAQAENDSEPAAAEKTPEPATEGEAKPTAPTASDSPAAEAPAEPAVSETESPPEDEPKPETEPNP